MTHPRIRKQAIEIAAAFYELDRTPGFRRTFPTLNDYLLGLWHREDGAIISHRPGWMYHIKDARALMATQLRPSVLISEYEKKKIHKALVSEAKKAMNGKTLKVLQRNNQVN